MEGVEGRGGNERGGSRVSLELFRELRLLADVGGG